MKTTYLLCGSMFLAACSNTNEKTPAPLSAPTNGASTPALDSAHQAYLEGDYQAVTERIRDVLLDPQSSDIVKENAYELLEKAYEVEAGKLPSTYVPPAGIYRLKYGVVNGMSGGRPFRSVYLYGQMPDLSRLARITVRHLPDAATILDSSDPQCSFTTAAENGYPHFSVEHPDIPALPQEGVVSVRFTLEDGTTSETWLLSHAQISSAAPELKAPLPSSSLRGSPLVSWTPFHSPEALPYEQRTIAMWISKIGANTSSWNTWRQDYADLSSLQVGSLSAGDYWLNANFGELRQFGPFQIARESRVGQGFHIVP